jgi:hypothetical protein
MFKDLFKAAKNALKNPIVQMGIGALIPGSQFATGLLAKKGLANIAGQVLTNPALLQSGIGLLSGAKPADVAKGLALGAGQSYLTGGSGGVSEFFGGRPMTAQAGSIAPASTANTVYDPIMNQSGGFRESVSTNVLDQANKPSLLEKFGLIKNTQVITNPDGSQSVVPVTDFFDKYSPILALGQVGLQVAAATLGQKEAERLYDPNQNPYLSGDTQITDVYKPLEYNKGGGVMDFPEKDGMIDGPGDGQSDDIPAMLSDGEFVMTKQAVMAAGNGDREQGTKKMYDIMYSLEDKAQNMGIGRV